MASETDRGVVAGAMANMVVFDLHASLLDALGESVVATDPDGRVVYWNDAAARLYGWSADEVLGSRLTDLILADGTARDAAAVIKRVRRRGSWSGEFMVRDRSGRVFPISVTATTVPGGDGQPEALVAVSRDISAQRQALETARRAEERLELVHRAAVSVIWEWDLRTDVVRRNDAMGDVFGYGAADVEPTMEWWRSKLHPDDRLRVTEELERFLSDDRRFWTEEYRFLTADHGYATVFDRAYVAYDGAGEPVRVVGTMVDLTERRRAHEEQRFLSQASMILELSLDFESTLPTIARLAVNSMADCCLIGVSAGDGFPPFVTAAHADPRLQPLMDEVAELLSGGPPRGPLLDRIVRGGESAVLQRIPEEALAKAVGDAGLAARIMDLGPQSTLVVPLTARRRTVGYAVLASASPDRIYVEGDLRIAEELGRRLGLTIDHARLFQSAELANRAKSDFLAVISHELRTPLTAVLGYAELLTEEVAGPLNETQHRQVSRIRAGSDRLLGLIEGILAFARLETGRDRPHFGPVRLHAILERAADMIRPTAVDKGVEFRIRVENVPDTIRTDGERLAQIVLSLLTNAVKFTDHGAVDVLVRTDEGMVVIDVTDSGNGIAPEHLTHIFNPFWQAEHPATRRAGGAGLGLSVARRTARLLEGDVVVAQTSPAGTTFRLQLPALAET
jgi:PAS domain S-box-containing protein